MSLAHFFDSTGLTMTAVKSDDMACQQPRIGFRQPTKSHSPFRDLEAGPNPSLARASRLSDTDWTKVSESRIIFIKNDFYHYSNP